MFDTLENMLVGVAEIVRPPERLTVWQAAEKYRFMNNPGARVGPYRVADAPYTKEFQECLTGETYIGAIFVGPAQASKTDPVLNWLIHSAICDPNDLMIISPTQAASRDFSMRRVKRLSRHNEEYRKRLIQNRKSENTYDFHFTSGMLVTLSHPTISELSGKPVPRLWLTDYDRMEDDVEGEGAPYDLAAKRATTFKRHGMTVAESSPSREVENPRWMPSSPHEAPPTKGILALYNRGDRRRWYWQCVSCKEPFEPAFKLLRWDDTPDIADAAKSAHMPCPHCGQIYLHEGGNGAPSKRDMNLAGRWIKEGQRWNADGSISGKARRSDIASFWMKGPAAAFTDWQGLVSKYLLAEEEFRKTGSEEALKTTINTDQGEPFVPHAATSALAPEELKDRQRELGEKVVPDGVRFLVASVDVQKNAFVVQVHGVNLSGDMWVVDRFEIRKSKRLDSDGERFWVSPGSYPEDWDLLTDEVVTRTYPLGDESGRCMAIRAVGIDSGGREGVTANAYAYWRKLRDSGEGLHARVRLLKGSPNKSAPRVSTTFPDAHKRDKMALARGDVPVDLINSNQIKDTVHFMLMRKDGEGGIVYFPMWLPDSFYSELTVEVRTSKGWDNPKKLRNEAWDLICYAHAMVIGPICRLEHINPEEPPSWAAEWATNSLVADGSQIRFAPQPKLEYDLAKLAGDLA